MRRLKGLAQQFDLYNKRLPIPLQHFAFHPIFHISLHLLDEFHFACHFFLFSYCKYDKRVRIQGV